MSEAEAAASQASAQLAREGDWVVLFGAGKAVYQLRLERDGRFDTLKGTVFHNAVIGQRFGARVPPHKVTNFAFVVLPLNPELYTLSIKHLTQCVYAPDLSRIVAALALRRGCVVVEAGTGSGSTSMCFSRVVGARGAVYSFECDVARHAEMRQRFADLGCANVFCALRDVCAEGLRPPQCAEDFRADAVFLDLPEPWRATQFVADVLRPSGRLCVFVTGTDQLCRTAQSLAERGFYEVEGAEVFTVQYEAWKARSGAREAPCAAEAGSYLIKPQLSRGHTGYVLSALKPPEGEESAADLLEIAQMRASGAPQLAPQAGERTTSTA